MICSTPQLRPSAHGCRKERDCMHTAPRFWNRFDSQHICIGERIKEYDAGIADIGSQIDDRASFVHATDQICQVSVDKDLIKHQRVAAAAHSHRYQVLCSWWLYAPDARDNSETIANAYCQPSRSLSNTQEI